MAGAAPPQQARPSHEITTGIRHLLDGMPATPAYAVDAAYNILAWNQLATHFIGNLAGHADRNMIRWTFRRSPADSIWSDEDFLGFTRSTVAHLRAAYARYPGDPEIQSLVTEMLALSPRFAEMWASHEVAVREPMFKRVNHPQAGPLEFECQVLHIAETGQRLIATGRPRLHCRGGVHPAGGAYHTRLAQPGTEHVARQGRQSPDRLDDRDHDAAGHLAIRVRRHAEQPALAIDRDAVKPE
jgi:MmyB-like transcription regulator ligand binding domain